MAVPDGAAGQAEEGRLWDVVHMLAAAVRRGADGAEVDFAVHVRNSDRRGVPPAVPLRAACGPGDDGQPGVTVMLPGES